MSDNEYIEEIKIDSYDDLVKIIKGKTDYCDDLRDKFIFRGVENENFKLIPSALRENNKLNDFVDEDFKKTLQIGHENAVKHGLIFDENKDIPGGFCFISVDKEGNAIDGYYHYASTVEEFQYLKEIRVLMNFFDRGDKVGLKIPASQDIRELLDHDDKREDKYRYYWPNPNYFELISLAQHHGVPTRALDWSYDYKVALYFAVKNILNENEEDCVLWAFNYKYFEKYSTFVVEDGLKSQNEPQLRFYRPRYYNNSNLKAQKGLFTFLINKSETFNKHSFESLDKIVCNMVQGGIYNKNSNSEIEIGICGIEKFTLKENERIFYKFIIPGECKYEILKELYADGYSEEYLFPGYWGVAEAMKNRADFYRLKDKYE